MSNHIILYFVPVPLFLGLLALLPLLVILRIAKRSAAYLFVFALFWCYLLVVASATLFPIPLSRDMLEVSATQRLHWMLSRVNLVPFFYDGFYTSRMVVREMVANVLMTIPFGFGIGFLVRMDGIFIPFLASAVGLTIEGLQLAISLAVGAAYRTVDINDVLLNAAGVLIGYGLFRIFTWVFLAVARRLGVPQKGLLGHIHSVARQG